MLSNQPQRVSETIRRENSKFRKKRDKWREQYAVLSDLIRHTKTCRANTRSMYDQRHLDAALRAFKAEATAMMLQRDYIALVLKETAYAYVDAPATNETEQQDVNR